MSYMKKAHLLSATAIAAYAAENGAGAEPIGVIELEGNLADAEKPPEIRAGKYTAEVQGVEIKTSGNSGNRYFAVKFVIPPENLSADQRDDYPDGAIQYWNRQLLPDKNDRRTLYNLRRFIEALGLNANTSKINPDEWMGQEARIVIKHSSYEGEMRAQISAVEASEGAKEDMKETATRDQAQAGRGATRSSASKNARSRR